MKDSHTLLASSFAESDIAVDIAVYSNLNLETHRNVDHSPHRSDSVLNTLEACPAVHSHPSCTAE